MDSEKVKYDALDSMFAFLMMGNQEASPDILKEYCEKLLHMMTQKTAGQRKGRHEDIPFEQLDMITNAIVIEAMALYVSGTLDRLIAEEERK